MSINKDKRKLLGCILIIICLLPSCIPIIHTRHDERFKNCTNDTLFIGASNYDHIDSVKLLVNPEYAPLPIYYIDTVDISLWKGEFAGCDSFVYPDSMCSINADYLFTNSDTCYFFLVRWKDAKRCSWDEIRSQKIFRKWIVVRNADGKFDRNIKYMNPN
ncbi:hypothetical protein HPS54_08260 [Prevotella sp. PCHR]|uniref:Lipoprotein n=1 Tax=Xylanibacter caecicola TaxID=2736294 RepID=A0ABX2B4V6_9BACT|nr:hypothetical protein [Xylanibacter caecicola]